MAKIISNIQVSRDFFLMKVAGNEDVRMGQFYMLRAWEEIPVLSRPISIFDADEEGVSFLYKVVGQGTRWFSGLCAGDDIQTDGPYGNGFPMVSGKIALVGGGIGVAPLYLAAKRLRRINHTIDCYLGFTGEALLESAYKDVSDKLVVNVGGYIVEDVNPEDYDYIFTCGPEVMMRVLYDKVKKTRAELYVSMENRMGCGVGACLVCSCRTSGGNRKVCKDGPVFSAKEVFHHG